MSTVLQSPPLRVELEQARRESGWEFVNGELMEKPVSKESSRVAMRVGSMLVTHIESTGRSDEVYDSGLGYQCFPEEPARFRKPDVSVIRAERLEGLPPDPGLIPIPADLVVEVLFPGDKSADIDAKLDEYLSNGFPLVWIVQPATRTVTIHRADGTALRLHERDEITGESALPEFRCRVADFFSRPGQGNQPESRAEVEQIGTTPS